MAMAKRTARWWVWAVVLGLAVGTSEAQTVDGVAVDADAELVVAVPDDTNNMDPRIGMGSTRSNYIRQVFESLVDVDAQGKPLPGLALSWKPVNDLTWEFTHRPGLGEPRRRRRAGQAAARPRALLEARERSHVGVHPPPRRHLPQRGGVQRGHRAVQPRPHVPEEPRQVGRQGRHGGHLVREGLSRRH